MKTNRRAFLKFFVGGIAIVSCPIPEFLLPKQKEEPVLFGVDWAKTDNFVLPDFRGHTLRAETIEEAAARSAMNMDRPDVIYVSQQNHEDLAKSFGFKVVYYQGDIAICPID